jgi:phage recombination protein Bet
MAQAITILAADRDLKTVRATVGAELSPAEFDHFVHMCRQWRLDPLRKQIYAIIYKGKTRRVTYITGIDGYRAIADRTGCYRPGERTVERDQSERDPDTNPNGIISATATVWKHSQGEWHSYTETVDWQEYAPLKEIWENNKPTGRYKLDTSGQWGKMGATMLKKCAEAQALRRGWPDDFSGLYVEDEMYRASDNDMIDITPTEQAERAAASDRANRIGITGPTIGIDFCDGDGVIPIAVGQIGDRVLAWIRDQSPEKVAVFSKQNAATLRQFWAEDADAALTIKQEIESATRSEAAQ